MKKKEKAYNWMPDFVYGGIDGAVTTFAVVAGVEGASLSVPIILIMGFANLFADGFSMASGKYQSDKAQQEQYDRIRAEEKQKVRNDIRTKDKELEEIIGKYGFKGKELTAAMKVFQANPDALVDLIMRNEHNLTWENIDPIRGALATFISFQLIGFIPLIVYVFKPFLPLTDHQTFSATAIATLIALFIVGTVKSQFSDRPWLRSGMETVFVGGFAAAIAYLVGYLLRNIGM